MKHIINILNIIKKKLILEFLFWKNDEFLFLSKYLLIILISYIETYVSK